MDCKNCSLQPNIEAKVMCATVKIPAWISDMNSNILLIIELLSRIENSNNPIELNEVEVKLPRKSKKVNDD